MTGINEMEKLRPCGRLETFSTARHDLGYYNNVGFAATYISPSSPQFLKAKIHAALEQVISKHANLSVITLQEDKSYPDVYFARLSAIDLRACVEFRERTHPVPRDGEVDEELDQVFMEQHSRDFKEHAGSKPFWRLAVLTSPMDTSTFTAAWMFHHAIADGASAMLFHETFLNALMSTGPVEDANPIVKSPTSPLPPPFEEQHPMTISWPFFLNAVAKRFLPSLFEKRLTKLWTGNCIPTEVSSPPKFNSRTIVLPASTTQSLAQLSRQNSVTVTATLQALLAASFFANLSASECDKVRIEAPMSMRPFLTDVSADQMTNAITAYEVLHQRPAPILGTTGALQFFSWTEAQFVKRTIQSAVAKRGSDNPIALLKYVTNMHDYLLSNLGKQRTLSAELSNIGVYKPKSEGQWRIGRMTFSQCANPVDAAFHVNVVTGGDGCASLNVSWCDGAVEGEFLTGIMEELRNGVEALVEELED